MSPSKTTILSVFLAALLLSFSSPANAAPRAGRANQVRQPGAAAQQVRAQARQARPAAGARPAAEAPLAQRANPIAVAHESLKGALEQTGAPFVVREANGTQRIIANVSGQEALDRVSAAMGQGANVMQILHIGRADINHSLAMFDGELIHAQYINGTGNWRLRNWGDKLRPSGTKMFSAFIALTDAEAAQLRANIAQGKKDQGPEHLAGPKWENGKLKNTSMGGCRSFNCTSIWTDMPLGANGETLARLAGVTGYSGHPQGVQRALETQGNERVIGIAIYGPQVENFQQAAQGTVTNF